MDFDSATGDFHGGGGGSIALLKRVFLSVSCPIGVVDSVVMLLSSFDIIPRTIDGVDVVKTALVVLFAASAFACAEKKEYDNVIGLVVGYPLMFAQTMILYLLMALVAPFVLWVWCGIRFGAKD